MLITNTERLNACASTATRPSATAIEGSVITSGTRPATTAPNTSSSTISAAGRPTRSSACCRSLCPESEGRQRHQRKDEVECPRRVADCGQHRGGERDDRNQPAELVALGQSLARL